MDGLFRQSGLMRDKWDRPTAGSTYGKITIENAIAATRDVYDPRGYFEGKAAGFRQPAAVDFADTPEVDPQGRSLTDFHPEDNPRYAWMDIGNGNLFADWYKAVARYVPERKLWHVYTGKLWEPDTGNVRVMEYCKELADNLLYYALGLPEGSKRDEYHKFPYLPRVTDVTVFSSGRVKVIPFNRRFKPEEQDKTLKKRLLKELSGVLNWCLEGLWLMQETGFDPPDAVLAATAEYRHDSDKLTRFVEDCLETDPCAEVTTTAAYSAYQDWCRDNGQQYESMTNFKRGLEGFATIKKKRPQGAGRDSSKLAMICGYRLVVKDFEELE